MAGSGSCNRFRGGFKLTGEALTIEQLATTMMACPDQIMQQEQALIRQLEASQKELHRRLGAERRWSLKRPLRAARRALAVLGLRLT